MISSPRKLKVLCAVVEQYIRSGGPVASREVARVSGLGLSPATIRSLMSALEDEGFLIRPHSSAGTIPSDRTWRLYVDTVTRGRRLSPVRRERLAALVEAARRELVEDFAWVARLMADATEEAGFAVRPFGSGQALEAVSLLPLEGGRVLGLLVTADGAVIKRLLAPEHRLDRERLLEISNLVTARFRGREIDDVTDEVHAAADRASEAPGPRLEREAAELMIELLPVDGVDVEVQVAGADNLLHSEDFSEIERVRSLFATLEDEQRIVSEIRRALASEPTRVIIGRESEITASGELGMVTTLFFRNGKRAGAVGVMGPKRMDYARIVPVVEYVGASLTALLGEPGAMHG